MCVKGYAKDFWGFAEGYLHVVDVDVGDVFGLVRVGGEECGCAFWD